MKIEPLFVCGSCDSDSNCHVASELYVLGQDLICSSCLDDLTEEEVAARGTPIPFVAQDWVSRVVVAIASSGVSPSSLELGAAVPEVIQNLKARIDFCSLQESGARNEAARLEKLLEHKQSQLDTVVAAMTWFCSRVEAGQVRSRETYRVYSDLIRLLSEGSSLKGFEIPALREKL